MRRNKPSNLNSSPDLKTQVTAVVESFEDEAITEAEALTQIRELTGKQIDGDWLRTYWGSESLEVFVERLCAQEIPNYSLITDSVAIDLITEFLQTKSQGRRDSIDEALTRRFGKPIGTLRHLVFKQEPADPNAILNELKRDTRIYL
ncbi:MAG TPA: hypothetical protein VF773_12315 [Verrucomicrobiae bacterium]